MTMSYEAWFLQGNYSSAATGQLSCSPAGDPWAAYLQDWGYFTLGEGTATMTASGVSVAGPVFANVAATVLLTRYVPETTPPTVTISRPVDGTVYPLDKVVSAAFKCVDKESGLASCVGSQSSGANPLVSGVTNLDTSTLGSHSVTVTGTDWAGNVRTVVSHYTVVYTWNGFFSPIGNESALSLNLVHAGDLIKIGFGLNGDHGLGVLSSVGSVAVACPAWAPHTLQAAGAGATAGLAYGVDIERGIGSGSLVTLRFGSRARAIVNSYRKTIGKNAA